jgi:Protein of unknown function (DUF3147)
MKIQIDTEGLKDTKWYEYALRFFFGGAMTVAAGIVAKEFGPTVGGLFLAFPAIFPAGATLIDKHEKEKKVRAGFQPGYRGKYAVALEATGATMGAVGLMIFALLVLKLLPVDLPVAVALISSAVVWFTAAVAIWRLCEHF